jgi:hypothetical protein
MAASYPTSAKSFSAKSTTDVVEAAHINDLQDEVTALETALLTGGLAHHLFPDATTRTLGTSTKPWGTTYISALAYVGDTANANMTSGLTLNQGVADDEILALKSSDIAHGMTTLAETDTYGTLEKYVAASGGVRLEGFTEATTAIALTARHTTDDTTKATTSVGPIHLSASLKTGTTADVMGANANIVTFAAHGTTRFALDADGDSHQDVGTAWTNFDSHDDALVLDSLAYLVSRDDDPYKDAIRKGFGEALEAMIPRRELERIKLVRFNADGHHFVNMSKLTMLLTGAARQMAGRLRAVELRIDRALPEAR